MNLTVTRGAMFEYRETEQGVDLFSVSQIRKVAHDPYVGIPAHVLEAARERGTRLHRRFWRVLGAKAELCTWPLPIEGLEGYCKSMDEWVVRHEVMPVKVEEASWCPKHGYAGTPDAVVTYGLKQRIVLLDLKTGEPTVTDFMQLVAYSKMERYEDAQDLKDLYIQKDGSPAREQTVGPGTKAIEWAWFLNALGVLQGRVNHGVR